MVIKSRSNFQSFTKFLNVTAVTLIVVSLINIGVYEIKTINLGQDETITESSSLNLNNLDNLPDIYYIILDGYARASTLKEIFNYDDSEFIDNLTNKGFYVASKSRSNYVITYLSTASSLNMEYINDSIQPTKSGTLSFLREMISNSKVSRLLKSKGYCYIHIDSGYDIKGMDKYPDVRLRQESKVCGVRINNFTNSLIQTTAAHPFLYTFLGADAREAILYAFDALAEIPNIKEPTFVFAHINCPHSPYVFDRNGNPPPLVKGQDPRDFKEQYLDQLIFVSKKVEKLADEILLKSDIAPIIILQADHGSAFTGQFEVPYSELTKMQIDERANIFNAYYLPEDGNRLLYESVTPVNSFRVIFNLYFDANYELLRDESYFSHLAPPFDFYLVPPEND